MSDLPTSVEDVRDGRVFGRRHERRRATLPVLLTVDDGAEGRAVAAYGAHAPPGGGVTRNHRHLRSSRVLCQDDGQPLTRQMVQYRVLRASRRAKLTEDGVHILRHHADRLIMPTMQPAVPCRARWHDETGVVNAA
jgi:hypothetical protein